MACSRFHFTLPIDGTTVVIDPVDGEYVFRIPHPTVHMMRDVENTRAMLREQHDTDGKIHPAGFLLVAMADAFLGTREMLRRLAWATTEDEQDAAMIAALNYLDIGFAGFDSIPDGDAVESISIDLMPTLSEIWEEEDTLLDEQGDDDDDDDDDDDAEYDPEYDVDGEADAGDGPETHTVVWALDGFHGDLAESDHATYALEAKHLPVGMYIAQGCTREGVRCLLLPNDNPVVGFARIFSSSLTA